MLFILFIFTYDKNKQDMTNFKNSKTNQVINERWGHLDSNTVEQYFKDRSAAFLEELKSETLFKKRCTNEKCVYNVSRTCKCTDIGNTCKSYKK